MNTTKLRELLMNEHGFAFDQSTGYTYNVNAVGVEILRWLKQGYDEKTLVQRLIAEYDVDPVTAQRDLDVFLSALQRYGLMPRNTEATS